MDHNLTTPGPVTPRRPAPDSPRSMVRLLGLFEEIARAPDGLSLAELSIKLGSPKSSLLAMLRPLAVSGHLRHTHGRYRLGSAIFQFAQRMLGGRQMSTLLRVAMQEVWERSDETVILTAIDREAEVVTYIECMESAQMVRYAVPPGTTRPLYSSAAGQVLLAFQEPAWRDRYIAGAKLRPMTPHTLTDRGALRRRLEEIRAVGLSTSHMEAIPGAAGVAVPIHRAGGEVREALLVAGPAERIAANQDRLRALMREMGERLSTGLGHGPEVLPVLVEPVIVEPARAPRGGKKALPTASA